MNLSRRGFTGSGAALYQRSRAAQPRPSRKNVLFLLSDQHRRDAIGIEGNPLAVTPRLDELARQGVRFSDAYCADPVCTPSRASIFTGLHTYHHRAWNNGSPWPFETKTIAHHFNHAGYMTAAIGKMHFVDAQTHGFDYRLDFNDWFQYLGPVTKLYSDEINRANSGSGHPQIHNLWERGDPWLGARDDDRRQGLVHIGRPSLIPEEQHFESFVARESIRFLREHGKKQPFFLVSGFLKPHDPYMPAERFAKMFRDTDMKLPETWGKVDLTRTPQEIANRIRRHTPTPELANEAMARRRIAMYWANVAQLDAAVGQVLDTLRELNLENDTIVVYSSDHGEMLGDHGLFQKFVFYEPSAGVPLIFRIPGYAQGQVSREPVSQVQLAEALYELCNIPSPGGLDGSSFLNVMQKPASARPGRTAPVHAAFNSQTKSGRTMLRKGKYKYSYYFNDMPELYDLENDPHEMRNLALEANHRSLAGELKAELLQWGGSHPSTHETRG